MKKEKRKSAFTLAELMVVIAIIAILATVSILGYKSFIKRETVNSALTEADQVREVITSQVIASTDGFVQVEYDGGNGTTQFTYDGGVLQIATFPPTYKTFANDYIGTGGKERSDCFDSAMRQKFPSLAGVPGLLTIDGSDIWYHHVGYQELYEYITKNGLQDIDFEPSEPFFKGDVAVNIMSMEYKTIDDSGVGDDPTDTPYKLSIDKYEVFVPLNGTETINFTVTPPTADIVKNGGEGIFTVSETRNSVGVGTFTLHGVQPGTSYLTLSVGNVHRAIKVNVGESGKHIIRAPIQNSSIPWDKESHFPKDTDWIYWGDYTYVIDGKNVKASEIFEIDESTRIPHSELGAYKVKFQFKEAYKSTCCWSTTFKSDPIEVTWKIAKRSLSIPKQSNILEYKPMSQGHISIFNGLGDNIRTLIGNMGITGEIQEPEWSGLVIKDENGADYDLVEHGIVKWSLKRDNDDIYQGIIKFLDDTNKPREHIGYSEPGIYMDAIFEIQPEYTDFYCWMDEQGKALNNPSVTVSWQIHKILIPDPTMPEELKYTAKNPPSTNRNDYFSGDGLEKAKDAGVTVNVYTKENLPDEYKKDYKDKNIIVFKVSDSQLDHYGFRSNEKAGVLIYKYTIEKESIPVPVFTGTKANYTYNNQQKSVRFGREEKHWMLTTYYDYFSDFDLDAETWYDVVEIVDEDSNGNKSVSSAKDAGTYSVIFKIKEPAYYKWDDSSSINKAYGTNNEYIKVNWEIYKIQQPSVTIANITLTDKKTGTTGVSGLKENAAITSVTSSSANFKVSFLGTTITVEALQDRQDNNDRTATITVNYGETTTYAAGSKTFTVTQKAKDAQSVKIENISLGSSTSGTTTVTGLKENAAITSVTSDSSDFEASYSGTTITVIAKKAATTTLNSATITVTYGSTDNYKGGTTTFTVTQKLKPEQPSFTINNVTISGGANATGQTTVPKLKESAAISSVTSDSNDFTAEFSKPNKNGVVTITVKALKARPDDNDRTATITVNYGETTTYAAGSKTFTVTQKAKDAQSVSIGNVTISGGVNATGQATVTGLKESAAITSVSSSNTSDFSASYSGTTITVKALKARLDDNDRSATITVNYGSTDNYKGGTTTFTVIQSAKDAQSVKIENISLGSSTSGTTTVTGLKENAAITSVSSSNTSDFSASYSGTTITVKALKARLDDNDRSATITVTYGSTDNYKGGTTTFTVTQKAKPTQNVTINDVTIDGGKGETRQTTVVFSKENATISKVESSNTSNFSASYSGTTITVTALKDRPGQFSSDRSATITVTYDSTDNYKGGTTTFTVTQTASCVTGDTLVTLADGSTKRIDELTYDDDVIVWDFFNGEYISCKPFTIFHHQDADSYIKLEFEDGNILKIVGSHKLFDVNTNKWEEIDEINCKDYIGHKFVELVNGNNKYVKLVSVEVINEQVTSYSVMTAPHINVVLANMLTFTPQRYDGLYEFFEVGENLTYDQDAMKSDIEKYGLYDSSAFEPYGLSKEAFDYVGGQYFKIFEGRGVITFDQTIGLINDYVFGRDVDDIVPR